MKLLKKFTVSADKQNKDERGASLVEYALLVALIAVICIAAVRLVGQTASQKFSSVSSAMQS